MVLRPGPQGVVWALPGMLLSGWFVLITIAGLATGMPFGVAAFVFGIAIAFGVLWVPIVLYLVGTRLVLDADELELRQWFGLRTRNISRTAIGRVAVTTGSLAPDGSDRPGVPLSYIDILDARGRRWARLRTWVWNKTDCLRLRHEIMHPGLELSEPRSAPADWAIHGGLDTFPNVLQSAGCVVQGLSMLFGFGLAMVIVAAAFSVPMGRLLGLESVPGALIGGAIGSSALLSRQVYGVLKDGKTRPIIAKLVAVVSMLLIPVLLWLGTLFVFSAAINILAKVSG